MNVYLDNAATTRVDPRALEAMLPYMTEKYGNASSLHHYGTEAAEALALSRERIAKRVNGCAEEIVFTSGGSESDNLALKGVAYALRNEGMHIITSKIEHPAVLNTCKRLESEGFKVTYLNVDGEGFIPPHKLEKAITKETILVSIMHANNEIGVIQDLKALGEVCTRNGVIFHTDAVQSFTKVGIDVKEQAIGLASFSSHKIHGPKGVGALYVREDLKRRMVKQIDGGSHEYGLRAGTENVAGAVGFAKATELMTDDDIARMTSLRDVMIKSLVKLPDAHLNGPTGEKRLCNNVNISFHKIEGESLLLLLDEKGVAVSTGSACSSKSLTPSHVLAAIGRKPEESHGSIRLTLGKESTMGEVEYAVDAVGDVVKKLRVMSPFV